MTVHQWIILFILIKTINERMKFRGKIVDPHCMKQFYSKFQTYMTCIYIIQYLIIILLYFIMLFIILIQVL
jgi:hypothetical protein